MPLESVHRTTSIDSIRSSPVMEPAAGMLTNSGASPAESSYGSSSSELPDSNCASSVAAKSGVGRRFPGRWSYDEQPRIGQLGPARAQVIEFGQLDLRQQFLIELPLVFDAGRRHTPEKVFDVFISQAARRDLITLGVGALHRPPQVGLLARQFSCGESMLPDPVHFLEHGAETAFDPALLSPGGEGQDVERLYVG